MKVELVVASNQEGVIGNYSGGKHTIPWNVPSDLAQFKEFTLSKTLIMGFNTWQSIGCRMLPKRDHIIVTSRWCSINPFDFDEVMASALGKGINAKWETNKEKVKQGSLVFLPIHMLVEYMRKHDHDYVCSGGAQLYKWFLDNNLVDLVRYTTVCTGDTEYSNPIKLDTSLFSKYELVGNRENYLGVPGKDQHAFFVEYLKPKK